MGIIITITAKVKNGVGTTTATMPCAQKIINAASSRRKNNLKLASEEDLHAVSNSGLTLRIRVHDQVQGRGGHTSPMSHAAKVAYESFGVVSIAVWPYLI